MIDIRLLPSGLDIENKNIIYTIDIPSHCDIQLNYRATEMFYYVAVERLDNIWESEVHFDFPAILCNLGNTIISRGVLDIATMFIVDARNLILREAEIMFNVYKAWYRECKKELGYS